MTHRQSGTKLLLYNLNPRDPRKKIHKERDFRKLPQPYKDFYREVTEFIPHQRVFIDPLYTLAFGTDASLYRLIPKVVVKAVGPKEIAGILKIAQRLKTPVTFRSAGTSLAGQALTDSILIVLQGAWRHYEIREEGKLITLEPGILGVEANRYLLPYGRKIGPDPASIDHCMIGGIASNNSSGMCCGVADNSYKTVQDLVAIFDDSTVLDTADPASRQEFYQKKPELIKEIENIRDEIKTDAELITKIKEKYKIKNTTGYSINAFVDFQDPIEIIKHLLIGSEGTLAFIANITYRTIIEHKHKASALIIYPDIEKACLATMSLERDLVSAVEMMDRIAIKTMEDKPGMPDYLKTLPASAAALLIEVRAENDEILQQRVKEAQARLAGIPTLLPYKFTAIKAEYEVLWKVRKGLLTDVGAYREVGTGVIIEDVAFPLEHLAEGTMELRRILDKYDYKNAIIFGHALDGNYHFVFAQDFAKEEEVARFDGMMTEVNQMVVKRFNGSLKAEHGTGRNVAPFVELEWGTTAYNFMKRIKGAFDPNNLINPGVIINENPNIYLENLKRMPAAHDTIDHCTNCGFCQDICPSKNLTTTPRMRIVIQREISELERTKQDPERLERLKDGYSYAGDQTCATDGLCAKACPISINTGDNTKYLRSREITPMSKFFAQRLAKNMNGVTAVMRLGLGAVNKAHGLLGTSLMQDLAYRSHIYSKRQIPLWNPWMPTRGTAPKNPSLAHSFHTSYSIREGELKVVYFPSCISRSMGPARQDKDQRPLSTAVLSVLGKAGYDVVYPRDMDKLCCGMPWESKGFFEIADQKSTELEKYLLEASLGGRYPVLCDTSPCLYRMKRQFKSGIELYDPVEFTNDFLLDKLAIHRVPETVAIHVTCSSVKMHISDKFKAVAEACAEKVIMPDDVHCCGFAGDKGFKYPELNRSALAGLRPSLTDDCSSGYSNSRTCEIGLSVHSGISYQSIMYLVDRCSEPLSIQKGQLKSSFEF